jgi:amidohydrolase
MSLLSEAKAMQEQLVAWRRDFHSHPEPAFTETRTTGIIAEVCRRMGLAVTTPINKTGVMAVLEVPGAIGTLALRADIDALTMPDAKNVPYRSTREGCAHACGHDAHTAMLLGAARLLLAHKAELKHRVKCFFQPAEETPPGGAKGIVEAGYLDDVEEVYAIHLFSGMPTGKLGIRSGAMMAATDTIRIVVTGRGGHGAGPELTVDPIVVAAHIITALQTVVSRSIQPADVAVVSICTIHAGSATNIIPDQAVMEGTVRSLDEHLRKQLHRRIDQICHRVAQAFGAKAELTVEPGYPVTVNDPQCGARIERLAREVLGLPDPVEQLTARCGGEDFAYYLNKTRGAIALLGSANDDPATAHGHHSPSFDIDENVLPMGAALLAACCMR